MAESEQSPYSQKISKKRKTNFETAEYEEIKFVPLQKIFGEARRGKCRIPLIKILR